MSTMHHFLISHVGSIFTLRLPENVTTGYSWVFDIPPSIQVVSDTRQSVPSGKLGQSGTRVLVLRPSQTGTFSITARYIRPWIPTQAVKLYNMTLLVTNPPLFRV